MADPAEDALEAVPTHITTTPAREFSPNLAAELASGLLPPQEVFDRYGINEDEARTMLKAPEFRAMVKQAKQDWEAADNAEKRIRVKARMALEELLPSQFRLAMDEGNTPAGRNEAVKIIKNLAGMDRTEGEGGGTGERFVVNINLGEQSGEKVIVDATVSEQLTGEAE